MKEIKPLSKRRRTAQLFFSLLIFVIVGPILVLLASGYSLGDIVSLTKLNIETTGGIYIAGIGPNSAVYLDNAHMADTSFLNRSILLQWLRPKAHSVQVVRPEYRIWTKSVTVHPNQVTEVHPVLIPTTVTTSLVSATSTITALKTLALDEDKTNSMNATTTDLYVDSNVSDVLSGGKIYLSWNNVSDAPYYLCVSDSCVASTTVSLSDPIVDFEWYPGRQDALIVATQSALYIVELDSATSRMVTQVLFFDSLKNPLGRPQVLIGNPLVLTYRGNIYIRAYDAFFRFYTDPVIQ